MPHHDDSAAQSRIVDRDPSERVRQMHEVGIQPDRTPARKNQALMLATLEFRRQDDVRQLFVAQEAIRCAERKCGDGRAFQSEAVPRQWLRLAGQWSSPRVGLAGDGFQSLNTCCSIF